MDGVRYGLNMRVCRLDRWLPTFIGTESGLTATLSFNKRLSMSSLRHFIRSTSVSFLWILPFIAFLLGYQLLRIFTHTQTIAVPSVVGLHMNDAIKLLSANRLNVRILSEKEEADLPEGVILMQTPSQGTVVKPHQSIFLVVTRRPPKPRAPEVYGLSKAEALSKAEQLDIRLKMYEIESIYPEGISIAQNVQPGHELSDKTLSLYLSSGTTPLRIFPDLKGKKVDEVTTFFKPYGIQVEVVPSDVIDGQIIDQRPLSGTLIDLKKTPSVTVTVR